MDTPNEKAPIKGLEVEEFLPVGTVVYVKSGSHAVVRGKVEKVTITRYVSGAGDVTKILYAIDTIQHLKNPDEVFLSADEAFAS